MPAAPGKPLSPTFLPAAAAAAPAVDSADYLNTGNATYSVGADVTWSDSGAVDNVISAEIGTNATAANKPSNLFSFKYFDTGMTVADVPSLQLEWERVSSPETYQTQYPISLIGFIFVPASTTPDFTTHKALWIAARYANANPVSNHGHTVRTDDQTWSWTTVSTDFSAPTNYGLIQQFYVSMKKLGPNSSGVAGAYGAHYQVGTSNYPGTGGGMANLYNTAKTVFHTLTSSDKIYIALSAGGYSGGSGTRTVTGRLRYWVKK